MTLLLAGAPEGRFDRLFDRMAAPPGGRTPDLVGTIIVAGIVALPAAGLLISLATLMTDFDASTTVPLRLAALLLFAGGGGHVLFWALRSQMKMPKYAGAGIAHYGIFLGFAILLLRTIVLVGRAYDPHFNLWVLDPNGPMPWKLLGIGYALMKDAVIGLVLLGVAYFIKARIVDKQKRLAYGWHATLVLSVIATMMIMDLVYDGALIAKAALAMPASEGDLAARTMTAAMHEASPLGFIVAKVYLALGITSESVLTIVGTFGWWTHVALVLGFLNYLPYGKHFHVITALFNVLFRSMEHPGRLSPMAKNTDELMEIVGAAAELANPTDAPVGVAQLEHLSWKSMLDFYTCTECGRCSDNCPAHRTGKLLSPKHFLLELRNHAYDRQEEVLAREGGPRAGIAEFPPKTAGESDGDAEGAKAAPKHKDIKHVDLVPNVIDPDILWGCTTCRACEEQCPVLITYVDKIVDMRRNLVLVKGEFPHELQKTFSALETNGNPWNITKMDRGTWADGLDIPMMREMPDADVLFWVGCAGSYDDNAKKISRATAKIMQAAKVRFAILGDEETCTGDPARRAGNEFLYMMLAEENVATLKKYEPKKIVTTCPHCFNTLLNEYPDLGARYEVVHHTDFILGLLAEQKITPKRAVRAKVAYHDSCYLGRYNEVYDSPRKILQAIPGVTVVEAELNREKGLCCGAGGAQMWMEEQNNDRVNRRRTLQLLDTGATKVATGCPFCQTMLSDGIKSFGDELESAGREVEQLDVAVLLERSLALGEQVISDNAAE
ncbi:MAG: (Fe-S)-binding protein [Deltaproteobacteria bacterium]|nr:(Fe-S)-binding protein [Deltaproteobacteria bacterium]